MSISFIIKFKVRVDKQADFHNIMNNVKSELPQAKGCIGVAIHQGTDDQFDYTLVETWESRNLHEKHVEGLVSSGAWEDITSHLAEDPVSGYYKLM